MEGEETEAEPSGETTEIGDDAVGDMKQPLDDLANAEDSETADPEIPVDAGEKEEPKEAEFPPIEPGEVGNEEVIGTETSADDPAVSYMYLPPNGKDRGG